MDWLAVVGRWPLETWITRFQEIIENIPKIGSITYLPTAFIFCDVKEIPPQKRSLAQNDYSKHEMFEGNRCWASNCWRFQLGESHALESHFWAEFLRNDGLSAAICSKGPLAQKLTRSVSDLLKGWTCPIQTKDRWESQGFYEQT